MTDDIKRSFPGSPLFLMKRPPWGILSEQRIEEKAKDEQKIKDQMDRIEAKLDKILGPQLINGVWR